MAPTRQGKDFTEIIESVLNLPPGTIAPLSAVLESTRTLPPIPTHVDMTAVNADDLSDPLFVHVVRYHTQRGTPRTQVLTQEQVDAINLALNTGIED